MRKSADSVQMLRRIMPAIMGGDDFCSNRSE